MKLKAASLFVLALFTVTSAFAQVSGAQFNTLINDIIQAESSGRAHVVGDGGKARGLMQIQKATWDRHTSYSWDLAFNPVINRQVGELIVKDIIKKYGARATAARVIYTYNTGRFLKSGKALPRWTKKHPNRIYRKYFNAAD